MAISLTDGGVDVKLQLLDGDEPAGLEADQLLVAPLHLANVIN